MKDEDSKTIFKAEARELIETIEKALLDLEQTPNESALVAKVFRAMHTLKGSGAMFGFDALADFAHHCETAFDRVRKGEAAATPELICAVLAAIDHLRALSEGQTPPEEERTALLAILDQSVETSVGKNTAAPRRAPAIWHIKFRFPPTALKNGTRPPSYLKRLRALGNAKIVADVSDVPSLQDLDPMDLRLGWEVELETDKAQADIAEIFEFDRQTMTLAIAPAAAAPPAGKPVRAPPATSATTAFGMEDVNETVRIPATRLDALMDCVGELVIAQSRLKRTVQHIENATLEAVSEEIERLSSELRESMMLVRMVPVSHLFSRFRRLVHDLSRGIGKHVEFVTEGEATELDKTVIERLSDPLIHLIRNAIDHGLETPQERLAAGKPETGQIKIETRQSGAEVVMVFSDDGRGLNREQIRATAEKNHLIQPGDELSDSELFQIIFMPGFSTAKEITSISGRGVGMDVVKTAIETLHGSVDITSVVGKGVRISLHIPLTLAIIDGLLIRVADERYVIPLSAVEECVELPPAQDTRTDGRRLMPLRGQFVPYLRLRETFATGTEPDPYQKVVIVSIGKRRLGLVVDEILGDHQTVIKPLACFHSKIGLYSGATILSDGSVALILDVLHFVAAAKKPTQRLALAG